MKTLGLIPVFLVALLLQGPAYGLEPGELYFTNTHALSVFDGLSGFLVGSNGFRVAGNAGEDALGWSVAGAGDVNGDGLDDVVMGAPRVSAGAQFFVGRAYVRYGGTAVQPSQPVTFLNGTNGFQIRGSAGNDQMGTAVAGGDFNGDGYADLAVGAPLADPPLLTNAGAVYLVFGGTDTAPTRDVSSLNGTNGMAVLGEAGEYQCGSALAFAGDVNGDGLSDLLVGAEEASPIGMTKAGRVYLLFGQTNPPAALHLADLDGTNGVVFTGEDENDRAGKAVAGLGDFNGDGYGDLIVGAHTAPDLFAAGRAYVVFGRSPWEAGISLADLDGSNGFRIDGSTLFGNAGTAVAGADVNGDGYGDALVGAPPLNEVYLVFGTTGFPGAVVGTASLDGTNGCRVTYTGPGVSFGTALAAAPNLNGDAYEDFVCGAPSLSPAGLTSAGQVFALLGRPSFPAAYDVSTPGGTNGFTLTGVQPGAQAGWSVGHAGDSDGDGFSDLVVGAYLYDYTVPGSGVVLTNAGAAYLVSSLPVAEFVLYRPEVLEQTPGPAGLRLTWASQTNVTYGVLATGSLEDGAWDFLTSVVSQGGTTTWEHAAGPAGRLFYRLTGTR